MEATELNLPVLPLRDIVVFPHMIVPLFVGREKSVKALEDVMNNDKQILLVTQKSATDDDPKPSSIYTMGTLGTILQLLKLPDGTVKVLVEGGRRAIVKTIQDNGAFFEADVKLVNNEEEYDQKTEMLAPLSRTTLDQFQEYLKLNKKIPPEILATLQKIDDLSRLADTISSHLNLKIPEKQKLLEIVSIEERLVQIMSHMQDEMSILQVEKRIRNRVKRQMEKTQRDYYLNEQMKAIQKELNDGEDGGGAFDEFEKRIAQTKLSKEAKEKAQAELKKLKAMSPMSAEGNVVRNYLEWLLDIPWKKTKKASTDIEKALDILNHDHYGLDKVKERIVEYLAVHQRTKKINGPILCLVGPPGVGKTSLGQSIAKSTNRNFVRMSLGGVRDESEIRGHRRTYVGSMPGRIIQGMKKAGYSNPLFLLDEIDKLGADWRGDPSSALLEVLDPEQNKSFSDHYLEVDYDLSDVMFVCTANSLNMPRPLLDRMEIIQLSGYTEDEKVQIAKRHLLPKQIEANGLKDKELELTDAAILDLVRYYTREAGVRSLERQIASLCRKVIKELLLSKGKKKHIKITPQNLKDYAGTRKHRFGEADSEDSIGVTTGLAWTEVGGELLSIESVVLPGKGKVTMTGKLGDVMKESIQAAEMLIKSRASSFGIDPEIFNSKDIHVHVPEGATPKDGPSAGVAMVTSIVSVLTAIPIRKDVAMTGEITLRGRVFPIGGLKEKLLAALRGGIKKVLIPIDNEKDLADIPANVKKGLEIIPVKTVDEVLSHALTREPVPFVSISGADNIPKDKGKESEKTTGSVITH